MGKWTIIDTSTNQEIGGVTENEDSCSVDINESTMCGKLIKFNIQIVMGALAQQHTQ